MTVTFGWCAGFESNGANSVIAEFDSVVQASSGTITASTVRPKTGARHARVYSSGGNAGNRAYFTKGFAPTRQFRFGCFIYPDFINLAPWNNGATTGLFTFNGPSGELICLYMYGNNSTLLRLSVLGAEKVNIDNWIKSKYLYLEIDAKINSVAGWVKVYFDGVEVLSFTGNTGNFNADTAICGNQLNGGFYGGASLLDIDDITFYDTTGEAAPGIMSSHRYDWQEVVADGTRKEFTPSTGTDHKALIDEIPNNETDYNYALAADLRDTFTHAAYTVPAGFAIVAVIPTPIANKTNAGLATTIKGLVYNAGSEGLGAEVALPTAYTAITQSRIAVDPATGVAWTVEGYNAAEIGYQSGGAFA